jgi:hypothetical protein
MEGCLTDNPAQTGREFMREVGDDPQKWAAALYDATSHPTMLHSREERIEYLAKWFADAIDAGRRSKLPPINTEET